MEFAEPIKFHRKSEMWGTRGLFRVDGVKAFDTDVFGIRGNLGTRPPRPDFTPILDLTKHVYYVRAEIGPEGANNSVPSR